MYLNFVSLINVCLDVFLHGFILYGTVLASWTLVTVSFTMLGKFFYYIFFKHLLKTPIFFFYFFCATSNSNVCVFNVIPVLSETVLICFNHFSLFILLHSGNFHHYTFLFIHPFFFLTYSAIDSF